MKHRAFLCVIAACICWGTAGLFVNWTAPFGFSSVQMTTMRVTISFIAMLAFVLIKDRKLLKAKLADLAVFAVIGVGLFGTAMLYYVSMQATSVSTAVVLMYTAPAYITVVSALFFGERFSKLKLVSVVCMLIGCCLVSGIIGGFRSDTVGILMGVLSGISYAIYNIVTKIALRRGNSPFTTTLYAFFFATVLAWCVCQPRDLISHFAAQPAATIPLAVAQGLVTCFIPYILYTIGMRTLPAGTASSLAILEPMAATVFSILLLGEQPQWISLSGIVLILLAVFLLGRAEDRIEKLQQK